MAVMDGQNNGKLVFIPAFIVVLVLWLSCSLSCIISPPSTQHDQYYVTHDTIPGAALPGEHNVPENVGSQVTAISWKNAHLYIGKTITVYGPVIDTHWAESSNGKPTFLNIGKPFPDTDRFTVIIWMDDRRNFVIAPEIFYLDKIVYVTGKVEEYNGSCEMIIRSPSQIFTR